MQNNILKKIALYSVVPILAISSLFLPYQPLVVKALEGDQYTNTGNDTVGPDVDYSGESAKDVITPSDPSNISTTDETVTIEESDSTYDPTGYVAPLPSNKTTRSGSGLSEKIVINPADRKALDNIALANSSLPDLKSDTTELSRLTGQSEDSLNKLRNEDWDQFSKIANDAESKYFTDTYLKQRLMASPEILAQMFNSDTTAIVQQMQTDQGKQYMDSAIQAVLDLKIDKRVIETLNYLVRPKNDPRGGAGHSRIQVDRIWNNYQRDSRQYSRESEVAEQSAAEQQAQAKQTVESYTSQTNPDKVNTLLTDAGLKQSDAIVSGQIVDNRGQSVSDFLVTNENSSITSAHHSGQAFDISQIDSVKCTLIKRRYVGATSKLPQPPINIKLLWQTTEGYNSDKQSVDSSINSMFQRMSGQSISDMLNNLGIDYSSLNGEDVNSFGDIMSLIGQQFLADAINAPTGSDIWKFNLSEVLRKIGGVVIADKLELNNAPFIDTSITTIGGLEEAIGRYSIENRLGLPYGSLKGTDRNTILAQIGRERIIKELGLPEGVFPASDMTEDSLLRQMGSRIIESTYGLPKGSFNKANLGEVAQVVSNNKLSMILAFPTTLDVDFGLADGTSARLKSGLALPEYLKLVAEAHILSAGYVYKSFTENCSENFNSSLCEGTANDQMFNLPVGTLQQFLSGTITQQNLIDVGVYSVANSLENSDTSRTNLTSWLNNPNPNFMIESTVGEGAAATTPLVQIQSGSYASTLGIGADDFYRIFGSGTADTVTAVYRRTGSDILVSALKNSSYVQNATQQVLASNPSLARTVAEVQFYLDRINTIKDNVTRLTQHSTDLNNYLNTIQSQLTAGSLKQDTDNLRQAASAFLAASGQAGTVPSGVDQITTALTLAGIISDQSGPLTSSITAISSDLAGNADNALNTLLNKVNAIKRDSEFIAKSAYEMTTGREQPNFRIEDLTLGNLNFSSIDLGGATMGLGEFTLFLSGQISMEDFLLSIASSKLAGALGIPAKALKYAAIALKVIQSGGADNASFKDIFFRAVGMAGLEESSNVNSGSILSARTDLAGPKTMIQIRDSTSSTLRISRAQANNMLAEGFGLKGYDLQDLMSGSFGAWSTARAKALANDAKSGLPAGTTEKFITGKPLGSYDQSSLSDDNLRMIATKMHISEASLKAFLDKRDGHDNPSIDNIYFVDHNSYTTMAGTSSGDNTICAAPTVINDPTQIIADNSFYYYDQDGQHVFNSYAAANEYRKANPDKVIDYVTEIANSIYWASYRLDLQGSTPTAGSQMDSFYVGYYTPTETAKALASAFRAKYPDLASIKNALNSFLNGSDQYAFGKDMFFTLQGMADYGLSVPSEITQKVFTRDLAGGSSVSVDYLKISGFYILQNFAASYINNALGMNIGSTRITPDDIYSMFDGHAMDVFARVGGTILDSTLGLQRGTTSTFLTATNSAQRNCAMDNAASQTLFNVLGIRMDLTGLTSGGLGEGKIETFLNLPHGSFKGTNIAELMNNLTPAKFAEAFQIPMPKSLVDAVDAKLKSIGSDYYNINAGKSIYQKISAINNYSNALGYMNTLGYTWTDINQPMIDAINAFLSDNLLFPSTNPRSLPLSLLEEGIVLSNHDGYGSYTADQAKTLWSNFNSRLAAIDAYMGFSGNETALMLQGRITPDNYKNRIVGNIIQSGAIQAAINLLGLKDKGITDADINQLVNDFKNNRTVSGGLGHDQMADLYNVLSKYFSVNLDEKLGVPARTIEGIIRDPNTFYPTLLEFAGRRVDQMLGIKSDESQPLGSQGIFELYVDIYFADDPSTLSTCNVNAASGGGSFNSCISDARSERASSQIRNDLFRRGEIEISDVLSEALNIPITFSINGVTSTSNADLSVNLNIERITSIFTGDLRPLTEIGMVMGLQSLYKGQNDQPYNLGNFASSADVTNARDSLKITNTDIELALYGDRDMEAQTWNTAATDSMNMMMNPVDYPWSAGPSNTSFDPNTGQSVSQNTASGLYTTSRGTVLLGVAYPNTSATATNPISLERYGGVVQTPDFDPANAAASFASRAQWVSNSARVNTASNAANQAVRNLRTMWQKNLQYKIVDVSLHRLDPNIPPDFARRMYEGNGWDRTLALSDYFSMWLINDLGWGDVLQPQMISGLINYFHTPTPAGLNQLMNAGGTNMLNLADTFVVSHMPDLFGIEFKPGTFMGILGFLQNGNFTSGLSIGSIGFDSLSQIYNTSWATSLVMDWAAKTLRVPVSTITQVYDAAQGVLSAYRNYDMVKSLTAAANVVIPVSDDVVGMSEAVAEREAARAELGKLNTDPSSAAARVQLSQYQLVALVITTVFSKDLAKIDQSLNLPPGTLSGVISLVPMLIIPGANAIAIGVAVAMLLYNVMFGVYKTEMLCTADGYYPGKESPPDSSVWDNGNLGVWDGMNNTTRQQKMVESAQYKANTLVKDLYQMPARTGDAKLVPTQVMTGRWEDVNMWAALTADTICKVVGGSTQKNGLCTGTKAGMWANPQTTAYTHVGF